MKKIVCLLMPFDAKQTFFAYEDNNKIDFGTATLDNLGKVMFAMAKKYDINQIDLIGPKQYAKGISNKLKLEEMNLYNENQIEINII